MKTNLRKKIALAVLGGVACLANVQAQDYVFVEPEDGTIIMEAEHYYSLKEGSGSTSGGADYTGLSWSFKSDAVSTQYADFSGQGYMQAPANAGGGIGDPAEAISIGPSVTYRILFQNTGVYHWYARCSYADWDSDSYHLGAREINGTDTLAYDKMNPYGVIADNWNEWGWNFNTASGTKATFTVTTPGYHEVTVLLREPNFRLDKIVLSLDDSYYPIEFPESEDLANDETEIEGATAIAINEVVETVEIFPNPVFDNATITYDMLAQGDVNISVYDVVGRLVEVLVDEEQSAGLKKIDWNVSGEITKGIYLVKITIDGNSLVKKVAVK